MEVKDANAHSYTKRTGEYSSLGGFYLPLCFHYLVSIYVVFPPHHSQRTNKANRRHRLGTVVNRTCQRDLFFPKGSCCYRNATQMEEVISGGRKRQKTNVHIPHTCAIEPRGPRLMDVCMQSHYWRPLVAEIINQGEENG